MAERFHLSKFARPLVLAAVATLGIGSARLARGAPALPAELLQRAPTAVPVLQFCGTREFSVESSYPLIRADLDNNGTDDLAQGRQLLLQDPATHNLNPTTLALNLADVVKEVFDADHDGLPDLLVQGRNNGRYKVSLLKGPFPYTNEQILFQTGWPSSVDLNQTTVMDANGDSFLDVAIAKSDWDKNRSWVNVILSNNGLLAPYNPTLTLAMTPNDDLYNGSKQLKSSDVNRDGIDDLFSLSGRDAVLTGYFSPDFAVHTINTASNLTKWFDLGDVDNDSKVDVGAISLDGNSSCIYWGDTFDSSNPTCVKSLDGGSFMRDIKIFDINTDGHVELTVSNDGLNQLSIFSFFGRRGYLGVRKTNIEPTNIAFGKFNAGDSYDIAYANYPSNVTVDYRLPCDFNRTTPRPITPQITLTPVPTFTATAYPAGFTPSPTRTPTRTETPWYTWTPVPTETSTQTLTPYPPGFTPSPTQTDVPTDTETPTQTATITLTRPPYRIPWPTVTPYYPPEKACGVQNSDVGLTIDISGSMIYNTSDGRTKIQAAKDASKLLVSKVRLPQDRIAVITFDDHSYLNQELTGNRNSINQTLDDLEVAEGTQINLGIMESHRELISVRRKPENKGLIVLLSDGISEKETAIWEADQAKADGLRMITIGLGDDANADLLRQLATKPEDYHFAPDASTLESIYRQIAEEIICLYTPTPTPTPTRFMSPTSTSTSTSSSTPTSTDTQTAIPLKYIYLPVVKNGQGDEPQLSQRPRLGRLSRLR